MGSTRVHKVPKCSVQAMSLLSRTRPKQLGPVLRDLLSQTDEDRRLPFMDMHVAAEDDGTEFWACFKQLQELADAWEMPSVAEVINVLLVKKFSNFMHNQPSLVEDSISVTPPRKRLKTRAHGNHPPADIKHSPSSDDDAGDEDFSQSGGDNDDNDFYPESCDEYDPTPNHVISPNHVGHVIVKPEPMTDEETLSSDSPDAQTRLNLGPDFGQSLNMGPDLGQNHRTHGQSVLIAPGPNLLQIKQENMEPAAPVTQENRVPVVIGTIQGVPIRLLPTALDQLAAQSHVTTPVSTHGTTRVTTPNSSERAETSGRKAFKYSCNACVATFASAPAYRIHRLLHQNRLFKCDLCEKPFPSQADLARHQETSMYRNRKCAYDGPILSLSDADVFAKSSQLNHVGVQSSKSVTKLNHVGMATKSVKKAKPGAAPVCNEAILDMVLNHPQLSKFKDKQTTPESGQGEKPVMYSCSVCAKTFKNENAHKMHEYFDHGIEQKAFYCNLCPERFFTKRQLRTHLNQHLSGERAYKPGTAGRKFECKVCGRRLRSQSAFTAHKNRAHGEKTLLQCNDCELTFITRGSLEQHIMAAHGDPQFDLLLNKSVEAASVSSTL